MLVARLESLNLSEYIKEFFEPTIRIESVVTSLFGGGGGGESIFIEVIIDSLASRMSSLLRVSNTRMFDMLKNHTRRMGMMNDMAN